jgi:hypothetical protein
VRLLRGLFDQLLVDHVIEDAAVDLGLLDGCLRRVLRLHVHHDEIRPRAMAKLRQQDGALANDGDDALHDRGFRGTCMEEREGQSSDDREGLTHHGWFSAPSAS